MLLSEESVRGTSYCTVHCTTNTCTVPSRGTLKTYTRYSVQMHDWNGTLSLIPFRSGQQRGIYARNMYMYCNYTLKRLIWYTVYKPPDQHGTVKCESDRLLRPIFPWSAPEKRCFAWISSIMYSMNLTAGSLRFIRQAHVSGWLHGVRANA
jgi:hypothetical protein